ncbi:hypothetical protein J1N35_030274 [Gossypium stocksii]|uniref:Aminotransferase-like plant mobile domain-containing protein n=1 Tax=Gossypium stocksii TaxID=47602 RepID=A0A9D3ZU02_9ROSI|nr:hypothetical protein J1N35_030274 [Gossypium stocksii]
MRMFEIRPDLILALVERWRPETYIFHLSRRECTITLENVALQLELLVDDAIVTGSSKVIQPASLCYQLLGQSPQTPKCLITEI